MGEQGDPGPAVALHWDGASWTSVEPPELQDINILIAVDAVSGDDVWAVGTSQTLDVEAYGWPLVEHWDGSARSVVAAPLVRQFNRLLGVRAFGPEDVWVVGQSYDENQDVSTLIMHWDGAAWTVVPSEPPGTLHGTAGVAADLRAVGDSGGRVLFRHWDGTRWRMVDEATKQNGGALLGDTVLASGVVMAAGWANMSGQGTRTLSEGFAPC